MTEYDNKLEYVVLLHSDVRVNDEYLYMHMHSYAEKEGYDGEKNV